MPITVLVTWPDVTRAQYDELRTHVGWDPPVAPGLLLHTASFVGGSLRLVEVWSSLAQFEHFMREQVGPALRPAGISSEPYVETAVTYAVYAPGLAPTRAGVPIVLPTQESTAVREHH